MCRLLNGITAFTLLVAGSASAQSSLPLDYRSSSSLGFFITGYADLSFGVFPAGSDKSLLMTELDLGYRPEDGGFGFSLGIDAFAFRDPGFDRNEIALYPAATFGTDFGTFSAGLPRSVLDRGYLPRPIFAGSNFYYLEFFPAISSVVGHTYLLTNTDPAYGLRYDVSFGATSVGLSYHRFNSSGGVNVLAAAIRHEFAVISSPYRLALFAGLENARSGGGFNRTNTTVGIEGGTERVNAGLTYRHDEFLGGAKVTSAYIEYMINQFTLSAAAMDISGGPTHYGVGVEYRFQNNAYANLSVVDNSAPGFNPVYEFSVGWRF